MSSLRYFGVVVKEVLSRLKLINEDKLIMVTKGGIHHVPAGTGFSKGATSVARTSGHT